MNEEFFEAKMVSASVSGVFVGSVTDTWMASLTTESSSEGTINTFWPSPARVSDSDESIDLVSSEFLVSLLQKRVLANSLLCHFYLKLYEKGDGHNFITIFHIQVELKMNIFLNLVLGSSFLGLDDVLHLFSLSFSGGVATESLFAEFQGSFVLTDSEQLNASSFVGGIEGTF